MFYLYNLYQGLKKSDWLPNNKIGANKNLVSNATKEGQPKCKTKCILQYTLVTEEVELVGMLVKFFNLVSTYSVSCYCKDKRAA